MSAHQTAYKCTERIDPKIKRRLRRSQEWQNKRDEMVNRRRNIGLMSPCTEFDLSLNSSALENALTKISEEKENKKITRESKKQQKCNERMKMLQKWKEEKELQRKQAALEKAKCKPFVVAVSRQPSTSIFDLKWEKLQKKPVKKTMPATEYIRKTRAGSATSRSASTATSTNTTTTATTRAATSAKTHQTDVTHKLKHSSSVLPEKKAPTRHATRVTSASESRRVPLATQSRVTRQTNNNKIHTRSTTKALPSTKAKTATSNGQKQAKTKIEPPVEDTCKPVIRSNLETLPSKVTTRSERQTVSFVPGNFVFTAPENLQEYDFSSSLSPNSTQSFFFNGFDEPPSNIFRKVSHSLTKSVEVTEEERSPNICEMVEQCEAAEKQDNKLLVATDSPVTPVRNDPDAAVFKTPVSSNIGLKPKKSQQSYSDNKPSNKKKTRKSWSCHKMDSTKVPQSPEEWVELLKNSPMIEMTRRKIPKHQLNQIPTFSLEDDDAMKAALKEGSIISGGQKEAEMVTQEVPVMEPQGAVEMVIQEGVVAVSQETSATATATVTCETPEMEPQEATGTVTLEAPLMVTQEAAVAVPHKVAETVSQEATETIILEAPVMKPQETVAQVGVVAVQQEISETVTQETTGTVTLEAPVMELQESVETVTHESTTDPQESVETVTHESTTDPQVSPDESSQQNSEAENPDTAEHNVSYFRNIVISQTEMLNNLSGIWETIVPSLSEEVEGEVRTVIGQAKLLVSQRFHQFIGLVDNCEFNTGEKETTCEDLQGFWDMVDFQVLDVKKKFADLQKLKDNNWQPEILPAIKLVKKVKKVKPVAPKVAKVRGRSKLTQFLAQKRKLVNNSTVGNPEEEAEKQEPVKVFDGHFFKVESPIRSPKPHCSDSSHSPVVMPVFTDMTKERSVDVKADFHQEGRLDNKIFETNEKVSMDKGAVQPVVAESSLDSPLVTPLISKRSYVPAIPSPLLQDITPVKKRVSTMRRSRLLSETTNAPGDSVPVSFASVEDDRVFVLQSPPRTRRRSQRVSKRISAIEPLPKSPSKDSTNTQVSVPIGQLVDFLETATPKFEGSVEKMTPAAKRSSKAKLTPGVQSGSRRSSRIARLSVFNVETCSAGLENHPDMNLIDFHTPITSERKSGKRSKSVVFADCITEENSSSPLTTVLCPVSPNVDYTETLEQNNRKLPRFGKLKVGYTPIRFRQSRTSSPHMDEEN